MDKEVCGGIAVKQVHFRAMEFLGHILLDHFILKMGLNLSSKEIFLRS